MIGSPLIHSFTLHVVANSLLCTYSVPGTVLRSAATMMRKTKSCPHAAYTLLEEIDSEHTNITTYLETAVRKGRERE